jgi:hypothetical protein
MQLKIGRTFVFRSADILALSHRFTEVREFLPTANTIKVEGNSPDLVESAQGKIDAARCAENCCFHDLECPKDGGLRNPNCSGDFDNIDDNILMAASNSSWPYFGRAVDI